MAIACFHSPSLVPSTLCFQLHSHLNHSPAAYCDDIRHSQMTPGAEAAESDPAYAEAADASYPSYDNYADGQSASADGGEYQASSYSYTDADGVTDVTASDLAASTDMPDGDAAACSVVYDPASTATPVPAAISTALNLSATFQPHVSPPKTCAREVSRLHPPWISRRTPLPRG